MSEADREAAIEENVVDGIKSGTFDGNTVTNHSIREQVEGDRHLANKEARKKGVLGISYTRVTTMGARGL